MKLQKVRGPLQFFELNCFLFVKQREKGFVGTVSKKLELGRWEVVDRMGKVEEFWWDGGGGEGLVIFQIKKHNFYVEVELEEQETKKRI